jgi:hypothetical protein
LGPNRIRAKRKRKIISGKPRFIFHMILLDLIDGNGSTVSGSWFLVSKSNAKCVG